MSADFVEAPHVYNIHVSTRIHNLLNCDFEKVRQELHHQLDNRVMEAEHLAKIQRKHCACAECEEQQ